MIPYWCHFNQRGPACIEAESAQQARRMAEELTGSSVLSCERLPYPAEPRIGEQTDCPSFCVEPEKCKGRGSCPQRRACTE